MKTIKYKGYEIEIEQDVMTESPRDSDNFDNLGTLATFHNNFITECKKIDSSKFNSLNEIKKYITSRTGLNAICLPVYLYSHSGETISTKPFSCHWDSGQLGFIYYSKEQARRNFGWKKITAKRLAQIKIYLEEEIETFDKYLKGEVFEVALKEEGSDEVIDCMGGYYDLDDCISQAKSMCDMYTD